MDRTHRWAAPIEALPVSAAQDRSLVAIADRVIKVLADNAVPFTVEAMQANEGSVSSRNRAIGDTQRAPLGDARYGPSPGVVVLCGPRLGGLTRSSRAFGA